MIATQISNQGTSGTKAKGHAKHTNIQPPRDFRDRARHQQKGRSAVEYREMISNSK